MELREKIEKYISKIPIVRDIAASRYIDGYQNGWNNAVSQKNRGYENHIRLLEDVIDQSIGELPPEEMQIRVEVNKAKTKRKLSWEYPVGDVEFTISAELDEENEWDIPEFVRAICVSAMFIERLDEARGEE